MGEKILVTRSSMPSMGEYIEEIKELWDSHWLTNMGVKHVELQNRLKEYMDVQNVELLTNGHMALELTIQALDLSGEVITTPFTFASTTHSIVRNELQPVFCDINANDYTIDVSKIESLITEKTSAIMPVHVYGNICDIEVIDDIAKRHGLKVIYDAAHTFGEKYKGVGVGNFGDASCFSFHATKVFNTIEGGAVTYKDPSFGENIRDLKNFGIHGPEDVPAIGSNAKMNEFCAAMGICNLRHIDGEIEKRKKVAELYRLELEDVDNLHLSPIQKNVDYNYSYFPVYFDDTKGASRDDIYKALLEKDIISRKYFYPLTNEFQAYLGRFNSDNTPIARKISRGILTLPLYSDLDPEIVIKICNIIKNCKK